MKKSSFLTAYYSCSTLLITNIKKPSSRANTILEFVRANFSNNAWGIYYKNQRKKREFSRIKSSRYPIHSVDETLRLLSKKVYIISDRKNISSEASTKEV